MILDKCLEQFSPVSKFSFKFAFASVLKDLLKKKKKLASHSHPIQSVVTRPHTFVFYAVGAALFEFDWPTGIYGFGFKTLIGKLLHRIAGQRRLAWGFLRHHHKTLMAFVPRSAT